MRMLATLAVLTLACPATLASGEKAGRPYVVLSGSRSHIAKAAIHRVTSQKGWTELWLKHLGEDADPGYNHFYNRAGVPEVNFDTCMVIAVFTGRGSNNAGLEVHSAEVRNAEMVIRFDNKHYQSRATADVVTPYGFFIVPRAEGPVLLQVNKQSYRSRIEKKPPVWEDYHRLAPL